jgi:23S rRNA A2030 N6-methylase RlmJ
MEYTHLTRIGNEGDLVKHAVLARFVSEILSTDSDHGFVYAETHTGRAEYRLPDKGRWEFGIGKFSEKLFGTTGHDGSNLDQIQGSLSPYIQTCIHGPVRPGYFYPGSSGIVLKMLEEVKRGFKFYLWDMDPAVCHSLLGFFENWEEVSICRGDGYEGVIRIERPSLVLVDPISIKEDKERTQIVNFLQELSARNTPFVSWTALVRDEEESYEEFKRVTDEIYFVDWVKWEPQGESKTVGCQITVPKEKWGSLAENTISEIKSVMGWKQ